MSAFLSKINELLGIKHRSASTTVAKTNGTELHAGRVDPRVGSGRVQFDE